VARLVDVELDAAGQLGKGEHDLARWRVGALVDEPAGPAVVGALRARTTYASSCSRWLWARRLRRLGE
jgi:hypothetical protein